MGGRGRGREGRRQACCLRPRTFLQMALASAGSASGRLFGVWVGSGLVLKLCSIKAHPTVYGWLIGSRVGASSVSVCEEGSFGRPSGRNGNGCRRFARLGLRLFCLLLVMAPKNAPRHLRTTQDVRRRSVKGSGRVRLQVGSVSVCVPTKRFALCASSGYRVAYGARWAAGVGRT
eukprot:scaffold11849_cov130-Isochrysis_galbana.AAC.3